MTPIGAGTRVSLRFVREDPALAHARAAGPPAAAPWFEVGDEDVELPDGNIVHDFGWIRLLDFAVIVALTADERTVLIRSYKHGVRATSLSLPGGGLHPGEDPLAGAKRELREETGFEADDWLPLGRYVVDPNYGCGVMDSFLARGAHRVTEPASGDLEEQELLILPFAEALAKLRGGEIAQRSTAAALGLAALLD